MSTFSIFIALIIVVCFLLILVVMVQNPKGGGLSSSFGGSSQQVGGVQKTSDFLDRSTWVLATLLLVFILISNATLSPSDSLSESKLLQENTIQESIPEAIPESNQPTPIEEIPEIPASSSDGTN